MKDIQTITLEQIVSLIMSIGGKAFFVGGCVRDKILDRPCHDHDILVVGLSADEFMSLFPWAAKTGNSFPVFRMDVIVNGVLERSVEFALARKERKSGTGHNGFEVMFDKSVTLEDDLFRRDTTMNAIAADITTGELIDPFGGAKDIRDNVIRAVSKHFKDDPIRALRAARQAAQFGFSIEPHTIAIMEGMLDEILDEPKERVFGEFKKALAAPRPSIFFRELKKAGLLSVFPEVAALVGKTQPAKFHPEGDAFEHSMLVMDAVASETDDLLVRFCALAHDFGKGETPAEMLPRHFDHDKRGADICQHLPSVVLKKWRQAAEVVCAEHMRTPRMKKPAHIVGLAERLHKTRTPFGALALVCFADTAGFREERPWWFDESILHDIATTKAAISPEMSVDEIHETVRKARLARFVELRKELA